MNPDTENVPSAPTTRSSGQSLRPSNSAGNLKSAATTGSRLQTQRSGGNLRSGQSGTSVKGKTTATVRPSVIKPTTHTGNADQHAHPCSLISVFVVRSLDTIIWASSWQIQQNVMCVFSLTFLVNSNKSVMIRSFRTDRSGQRVQIQIRLPLEEQSDQGLYCLQCRLFPLDAILYG